MKYLFFLVILLVYVKAAYSQKIKGDCHCPNDTVYSYQDESDTIFSLKDGNSIILCGYTNRDTLPNTYSEFILSVCGSDTAIDSWNETSNCTIRIVGDTLEVLELEYLPTGKNFKYQSNTWITDKIYFKRGKIERDFIVNRNIRPYTIAEINIVLNEFASSNGKVDDYEDSLAYKLFIASISGSRKARKCFTNFKSKFFDLDGVYAEDYEDLIAMLALWDEKEK